MARNPVPYPLLANLFLHYAFDYWMQRRFPSIRFERYADDAVVHCRSEGERGQARARRAGQDPFRRRGRAQRVLEAIRGRLAECGLELNDAKTKVIYCKDDDRKGRYEQVKFAAREPLPSLRIRLLDAGYTFQSRRAKNRWGGYFVSLLPAISAKKRRRRFVAPSADGGWHRPGTIRSWRTWLA